MVISRGILGRGSNGARGLRDYSPGYYAVFFYDPDGIKLEILHLPDRAA